MSESVIETIKKQIDLHDLAERLGLERPDNKGNYRNPTRKDIKPSLAIHAKHGEQKFIDFASGEKGDHVDLVMLAQGITNTEAIRWLCEQYGIERDNAGNARVELTTEEYIAQNCMREPDKAIAYLTNIRKLPEPVVRAAIARKTLGWSTWTSNKVQPGELGYGGDAVAFICKELHNKRTVGLDFRYIEPALNGDLKTKSLGDKTLAGWTPCLYALKDAHTVVLVESAINALTVAACAAELARFKGWASYSIRGTNNSLDWSFLRGKRVIICLDNDPPDPQTGYCPGEKAAWRIHEELTIANIPAHLVNQGGDVWNEHGDLNEILQAEGVEGVGAALLDIQEWLIPGLPGNEAQRKGRPRQYLPAGDFSVYFRYRTTEDFTTFVTEKEDDDGVRKTSEDVCGFRIAALSRIEVASELATFSGEKDIAPRTVFAASTQIPRHKNKLVRRVLDDDAVHNPDHWRKFGPVFKPARFQRMVSIWERATSIGERRATNFVGLCYKDGKPALNEAQDCYFTEPDKQCPYHNLYFPDGPASDAAAVINAYQATMSDNAATMLLVWGLGAHLKLFFGYYPHMVVEADKGAGKTTLVKRLERTIGFTMFSGQSLQTDFRILTSICHTSHPVGWEELSARGQVIINRAVALLQESYNYTVTKRGFDMTPFLISAPVLLAGEEVSVSSLLGKVVQTTLLASKKGKLIPENLPRFPVRAWLLWVSKLNKSHLLEKFEKMRSRAFERSAADKDDDGGERIVNNFALQLFAWHLLCEFAGISDEQGGFYESVLSEMNTFILKSKAEREPWVWITEILLGEIDKGDYKNPYLFEDRDTEDGADVYLFIRPTHVMQHLSQSGNLRAKFDGLPVKTAAVYQKQLTKAGVIVESDKERKIGNRRVAHLQALSIKKLGEYGLSVAVPDLNVDLAGGY